MAPLPPEDPITIPRWATDYLFVPLALGLLWLLRWLGIQVLEQHHERVGELEEKVDCLEDKLDRVLDEVEA